MGLKESGLRGSLRNVSVGIDAIPDVVLLPDENDLDNFDNSTELEISSADPNIQSDLSLKLTDADGFQDEVSTSTSGLNRYPESGEQFGYYYHTNEDDGAAHGLFGVQDSDNFYGVWLTPTSDEIRIVKDGIGGTVESSATSNAVNTDEFYYIEVDWLTDGTITARVFEVDQSNGDIQSEIGSVSTTDEDYSAGGIGIAKVDTDGTFAFSDWFITEILD